MASRYLRNLFILFVVTAAFHRNGTAQTTTSGGLAGVITDERGAVVQAVDVEIHDLAKGTVQSTKTDQQGVYRFFFVFPGHYLLRARQVGFREENLTADIPLGPPLSVNIVLRLKTVKTEITVNDELDSLRAENGDVAATINQQQVSELPNPGNDLTYVVQTAPGVLMNTDVAGLENFSILGMPGTSYLHTIDGMNDNDNGWNLSLVNPLNLLLGQNQVQEAAVVSTGYSGQFGGAAGGNINYVTKSGGNRFHGNAQYYWNGRVLNANDRFSNAFGQPRPFSVANQWAGSIAGPIRKDKLFFFFDTEGLRLQIPQQAFVTVPSPAFETSTLANIDARFGANSASSTFYRKMFGLYNASPGIASATPGGFDQQLDPLGCQGLVEGGGLGTTEPCSRHFITSRGRPSQDALVSERTDWNMDTHDRVFLRMQYDRGKAVRYTDPISPLFDSDFSTSWWQAQTVETHSFGSSTANQLLVAGSYFHSAYSLKNIEEAMNALPATLNFVEGPFSGLGSTANFHGYIGQFQVGDDFFTTKERHKLGFGANVGVNHWHRTPNLANTVGRLNVQTLDAFYQGGVDLVTPDTDFTSLSQSFTSQTRLPVNFFSFGLYAEDEWSVRSNLKLTVAMRLEHYGNPTCRDRCFARLAKPFTSQIHDPNEPYDKAILVNQERAFAATDAILWSPRISFAWQPFAGNTVVRGGVGIFYDPLPGLILDSLTNNPPLYNSYNVTGNNLSPGERNNLFTDAKAANDSFLSAFYSGQTIAEIEGGNPMFSPPAISSPEGKTHAAQFQRWSFELEKGIGSNTSVTIGYHGHHGIHGLVEDPNANAFGFGSLPAGPCKNPPVPPCTDSRFTGVTEISTDANSSYHGMVASFRHHLNGSTGIFQANYTYGHAMDESGGLFTFTTIGLPSPQDPNNLRGSYGSSDYDVRHSFNANYVWDVPVKASGLHDWKEIFAGWQLSGTVFARTGFPYTVFDFEQSGSLVTNNYFGLLYAVPSGTPGPTPACGKGAALPVAAEPCQRPQLTPGGTPNPEAGFLQVNCLTGFNVGHLPAASGPCDGPLVRLAQGRNRFRGPGYFNTDFAIAKSIKLAGLENGAFRFGLQFFNVLNHPNFGFPDPGLSSPTFGQIFTLEQPPTSLLGSGLGGNASPRMIQIKAELQF